MTFDEWVESKNNLYINRTVSTFRWNCKKINNIHDFFELDERQRYEIYQVREAFADIMGLYMEEQMVGYKYNPNYKHEYECIWEKSDKEI